MKGTTITIDNGEPVEPSKFFNAANCQHNIICNGVCNHETIGAVSIDQFLTKYGDFIEQNVLNTDSEKIMYSLSNFLTPEKDNRFKINKESFLEHFRERTEMERQLCDKYSMINVSKEVDKLPDEIQFMSREEYQKRYAEERIEPIFVRILTKSLIDSSLSHEDMLRCSKITSLMNKYMKGNLIKDTDIWIYAFPEINQYVMLKLIAQKEVLELINHRDFEGVIVKEGDFFCVKNPDYRLYFQIVNEEAESAKNYYESLKNLK